MAITIDPSMVYDIPLNHYVGGFYWQFVDELPDRAGTAKKWVRACAIWRFQT
jgi:hypothetical protein